MIKVRIVDNDRPLLLQQMKEFGVVLQNLKKLPQFNGRFDCNYIKDTCELELNFSNTEVRIDTCFISLSKNASFNKKINEIIAGLNGDKNILVVDYSLNGPKIVDESFYIGLTTYCDYELIYTGWSNYNHENIERLKQAGCYFIERAASDDVERVGLNWRASTIAEYDPEYYTQIENLSDTTIKEICLLMVKSDNVNLRFLSTILLLIGKVM